MAPSPGPCPGDIIAQDTLLPAGYEATATYSNAPTADGSESTPGDDAPAQVSAEIMASTRQPPLASLASAQK